MPIQNLKKINAILGLIIFIQVFGLIIYSHFSYPDTLVHAIDTNTGKQVFVTKMDWYKHQWDMLWRE